MDWEAITPALRKKLDPAHVKAPPRGKFGEYIEGWHAIAEANDIFGFGGWSYTIDRMEEVARECVWLETPRGEKYQQWRVCHICYVRVEVGGVVRNDVGTGQGQAKLNSLGDAIDSSVKEAVTDALKRSLRSFGNRFGLALYDKTKANVGVDEDAEAPLSQQAAAKAPPPKPAPTKVLTKAEGETIIAAIGALTEWRAVDDYEQKLAEGPMAHALKHPKIEKALADRRASLNVADPIVLGDQRVGETPFDDFPGDRVRA